MGGWGGGKSESEGGNGGEGGSGTLVGMKNKKKILI